MQPKDIVVLSSWGAHSAYHSWARNLFQDWSGSHRVLFVTLPEGYPFPCGGYPPVQPVPNAGSLLVQHSDTFFELHTQFKVEKSERSFSPSLFDMVNKMNNRRLANEIWQAMRSLKFRDIWLVNESRPIDGFYLPELLEAKQSTYLAMDISYDAQRWVNHGLRLETEYVRRANLVLASSVYLADTLTKHNRQTYYLPPFAFPQSEALAPTEKPRYQVLAPWLSGIGLMDMDLLASTSRLLGKENIALLVPDERSLQAASQSAKPYDIWLQKPETWLNTLESVGTAFLPFRRNTLSDGLVHSLVPALINRGVTILSTPTKALKGEYKNLWLGQEAKDFAEQIRQHAGGYQPKALSPTLRLDTPGLVLERMEGIFA